MLDKIIKFFFDDTRDSISFYKLYTSLVKWQKERRLPYEYELPQAISLDESFHKQIINLYKSTLNDGLERAVSVYWADGDLIVSRVMTGTSSYVKTDSNIKVSYKPSRHKGYYTKEVYVDEKVYSKRDVYHKNIPTKIELKYLFNMHTHPRHTTDDGYYYGTFSSQDIKSLVQTDAVITGLIRDDFTLLFKTNRSIRDTSQLEDRDITLQSLTEKYGFVVYTGKFKGKLYRFSPQLS
jgi:hypothetical protein